MEKKSLKIILKSAYIICFLMIERNWVFATDSNFLTLYIFATPSRKTEMFQFIEFCKIK